MGLREVAGRARQEIWKWLERTGLDGPIPSGSFTVGRDRFFAGAGSTEATAARLGRLDHERRAVLAAADALCQGRFDLLGYRGLTFGDPVDWHFDPISGRRAPLAHWSRIDPLDHGLVGDSKVIWELNRHQWMVRLGQAYRLTGDERYATVFGRYLGHWLETNPAGRGMNWASSLEVSLRLIAWCWSLSLFERSPSLPTSLLRDVMRALVRHAAHVERYLSHYFSPNTHLTGEALGLFYAGTLFPELRHARRWRALGARILVEQSAKQVLPDGVYFEQSTYYQRYTIEIYLHFVILARRSGLEVPAPVVDRLQRLLDFLLVIRHPDGSMPMIGDADGGWLLPLTDRAPQDVRGVFATAASLFGRRDYAWAAGGPAPETLWLLGPAGAERFAALDPEPPAMPASRVFPDGGYIVTRSGWQADAHQLIFDVGPLGCPVSGGHGHADLLSVQCAVFGEPCLTDAGTYGYTGQQAWRSFFRGTSAHSTVMIDGAGQAVPTGPFAWHARPRAQLTRWESSGGLEIAEGSHQAYSRLADPVIHRRRVIFVARGYWILVDDLEGAAEHGVELRFQFAPIEVTVDPTLWAWAHRGARGLLLRPFASVPLKADIREGALDPVEGWIAPTYGERRPAPVLIYSTVTPLPVRIATLLLPLKAEPAIPPAVALLSDDRQRPIGLTIGARHETIWFDNGRAHRS